MGNANCNFVNDLDYSCPVYVFNYADGVRVVSRQFHRVRPGSTVKCEAAAHGDGLILVVHKGSTPEYHQACANGSTVKASEVAVAANEWTRTPPPPKGVKDRRL